MFKIGATDLPINEHTYCTIYNPLISIDLIDKRDDIIL